jgi:twitching motility protein PilT
MEITALLTLAANRQASDLHLSTGSPPIVRIDGQLEALDMPVLEEKQIQEMVFSILNEQQRQRFAENHEFDFAYEIPKLARFRINTFRHLLGMASAFRVLPCKIPSLEELGCADLLADMCKLSSGLVLVTGPTGSGKSTTLAAMLELINKTQRRHIVTIEDPIEYTHASKSSLIQQREVGTDTASFQNALRSVLREDPDVILVGEMRDLETIRLALTAAETGHLVFATLHTRSAAKTINRIIDVFPGEERHLINSLLSEALHAVVSQTMVNRVNSGRTVAQEIMICTPAIRNLIRQSKTEQIYSAIQTGRNFGMRTLNQHLEELLAANVIIAPEGYRGTE